MTKLRAIIISKTGPIEPGNPCAGLGAYGIKPSRPACRGNPCAGLGALA